LFYFIDGILVADYNDIRQLICFYVELFVYQRTLNLHELLQQRSYFLLGPRGTGKSTLIEQTLPNATVYDLLDAFVFQRLLRDPTLISQETNPDVLVVIDEVQKLPELLDEVHRLIVKRKQRFLLTGSKHVYCHSPRKKYLILICSLI
jgi:predicted AAA+ superfamily ATPase